MRSERGRTERRKEKGRWEKREKGGEGKGKHESSLQFAHW